MNIHEILWLPRFEDKIWIKYHVLPVEVEDMLFGKPRILFAEKGVEPGEDLYVAYGHTMSGRYLTVYFIRKSGSVALILSARDMDKKERKRHGKRK
ncbi:MAG: BrnT family toxin [Caldilineaceae bacterium]|nr:BrnT family toxin [Caldilineaceae bacterium]MBP8106228.1 BrnT family toxin [Caldilineaceae bacterium]MBP8121159.1 BrnT family toxin [Caldilineaceae bacterium]MBP9071552.1 BrnT family toxin [Caldilineaceae bacterium]